jgi:hypothetical protein
LETFIPAREFTETSRFPADRRDVINTLDLSGIDRPIVKLIDGFRALPQCFPLQSCYGHFLCRPEQYAGNLERLPADFDGQVRYRIAYIALCIENSARGRELYHYLDGLPLLDPQYVQFGSADWFWQRYPNSYILQVEPLRYQTHDQCVVGHAEALIIERIRDRFFVSLENLLERLLKRVDGA